MECASEPDGSAAGTEPRSRRAAVAPSPRTAATLLRGARAAALAVAALALGVPGEAQAQTVTTFISNVGQSTTTASDEARATAFTTGGNTAGYGLTSVEVNVSALHTSGVTPLVEIFQNSAGAPGTLHATLLNPATVTAGTTNTFNAQPNTMLSPNTVYWLVVSNSDDDAGQGFYVRTAPNNTADVGAAMGWSIGNALRKLDIRSASWLSSIVRIFFAVKGTAPNTAAMGAPTITGTAQVGETLTAVTTGITDADGLTSPTYTYQWIRVDGTEADIAGENSSTYTLVNADLGKTIKVKVSFDDDASNTETLTSDATATVTGVVTNNAPVFNPATVTLEVDENTLAGQNVGSPVAATDADSDTLSYTLEGADKDAFDIVSTSGQIQTSEPLDHEAKASYLLTVRASDATASATAAVTVAVGDVDEPPLAPDSPEVVGVPGTFDSLSAYWDPPDNAGRPAITGYDIRYARDTENPFADFDWIDGPEGVSGTTATVSGLEPIRSYFVAVRAVNAEGESAWSKAEGATTFRSPSHVQSGQTYVPSELTYGDIYRILFVTGNPRPASHDRLSTLNSFVGSSAIGPGNNIVSTVYLLFRAVASTRHVDAMVNTDTTYTAVDKGVPIYWANGGKVADDYEDFYDGDWDDEANARNESGNLQALPDGVWTGSGHDGTEFIEGTVSRAFGQDETGYGTPGSSRLGAGPLYSGSSADSTEERPLYALSLELRVAFPVLTRNVHTSTNPRNDSDITAGRSQRFATGGNLYGYELDSIDVDYGDSELNALSAALYTVDAQGRPDTLVGSLTPPPYLNKTQAVVENRFAAPPGTVLDPGTTYAVVFRPVTAGEDVRLRTTAVDSEDPDGQADWSIADTFEVESAGSWQADADSRSLRIEVRGTVRTGLPGQPTGLGATKLGRYRIDLAWTAPAFDGNLPITGYRIEASPDGVTDWTDLVSDTGSTDTAYSHTPLAPSTTRHYRVSAINSAGTGDPSGSADATTDPNTPPAFTVDAANVSVPENTLANTNISGANRTATDPDGDSVTYSFQTSGGVTQDYQSFNIDSGTGQVKTKSALDHEAKASYEVSVIATDIHGGIDTIAYSIAVGDAAEPPAKPDAPAVTATPGATDSVEVSWAAPANAGKPPITGYDLQYRQGTSGSWTNGPQNVATTSAAIPALDGNRPYDVQVRAKNDEGDSDWSDPGSGRTANNAPVLAAGPLTLTVPENTAADIAIGAAVGASDADSDPLTYTLEGADDASFAIVETSGQIRVQAALDFEATNSYSVTVRADDGTDSDTVAVTIDVTDVDEPPVPPGAPAVAATSGTDDSLDVAWTAPANAGKPAITSYDLQYRPGMSGNWIDGPQDVAVTSAAIPDLSPRTSYQVEVRATNAEGDSDWSSPGTGSTNDPLNSAPTFANPTVTLTLPENTAGGVDIGSPVEAVDADAGDTLTYSLTGADATSFTIVTSSGQIRTRSSVTYDFEAPKNSYSLSVTVTDQTANSSASVTINLSDVDEPPAKPAAPAVAATPGAADSLDVSWAAPANAGKPAITSYDLRYRKGDMGGWTERPSGVTTTSATIDGLDGNSSYQVEVLARNDEGASPWSDPGSGRTGNSAPVFDPPSVTLSVPENTPAARSVGSPVQAADSDSDTLEYALVGSDGEAFDIDSASGQIRTMDPLNHETTPSYSFRVRAEDGNGGTAFADVRVDVSDVNEPPATPLPPTVTATAGSNTSLTVSWTVPANAGKPAITSYDLHYRPGTSGNWINGPQNVVVTNAVIPILSSSTSYQVEVRATNADGDSGWSDHGTGSTGSSLSVITQVMEVRIVEGNAQLVVTWTAVSTATGYTVQWMSDGEGYNTGDRQATVTSGSPTRYTIPSLTNGTEYTVRVIATRTGADDGPPSEEVTGTPRVPNTAATGAPTITGTAQVGETLTASTTGIADANGLTSPTYTYQWIRVDGTDEADIASANSSTYILVDADLGKTLKVKVTFADDLGHTETLTSEATATVGAAATAPTVNDVAVTSTPASGNTYYLAGEVIEFTVTFSAPVTVTATPKFAFRLGAATRQAAYASGSDSTALVFARTVQAGEVDRNGISWNALALALDGGTITQTGATTAASLTHAEQAPLEGHRVDAAPPMQVSASVHGMSLVLVYDEPLDPASMPATGAYTVTATVGATTTNPAVSAVSIYGIWVTLTLDAAPAAGATVTLAYAPPASNPVQDEAGNDAPAFSGQKVNGAAGNTAATGAPTITGTAQVGETLTAVTTGIADADGLTTPNYTYQWIRVNGTEADIAGENSSTYTLVDADLGTTLKVKVSFDDDASNTETLTSAASATVTAAGTNAAPVFPVDTLTLSIAENTAADTNIGAVIPEATDADSGDTLEYSMEGTDAGEFTFDESTRQIKTKTGVTYDFETKSSYSVTIKVSDGTDSDTVAVTITLTDVDEQLTVQMTTDPPPPLEGPFTVRISFSETVTGFSSSDIATQQQPACTDSANNSVSCNPTIAAVQTTDDRIFTTTVTPQTDQVAHNYTLTLTVGGGAVRSSVGNKPNQAAALEVRIAPPGVTLLISSLGLTASAGNAEVRLNWNQPTEDGGSAIIRYEYRFAAAGEDLSAWENVIAETHRVTVGGLINGREYVFEVRAVNALGKGEAETVTATPHVVAPPPPPPPASNSPTADAGPDQLGVREGALVTLDGSGSSDPDDDPLRYLWNQLSGEPVVLSSQNVVNPTFTAPRGLTADAVLIFRLLVTDPSGHFDSDTVTITVKQGTSLPGDRIYYFPHLAVGAGWQTTITYINYSPQELSCRTEFLSDQGTPLMVSFAGRGTVVSLPDVLPPGGSVHHETNVELSAPLAPGWARATCSGPVKASLLFRWYNSEGMPVAEAGVNATTVPATRFVTFAEQGEGKNGTGVAYANPSDTAALVTFTARDADGEVLAIEDLMLPPNGHGAQNMPPLFGLPSFTGSLEVTSTEPIVSLSLNFEAASVLSSLPPGELDAAAQGSTTYYFTHLAVGARWQTTITYINYSSQEVTCETDFISDFGNPLMVSFEGRGTGVSRTDVLPPGGCVHQETNVELSAPLTPGWARATCSGPVKASLLYRRRNSEGVPTGEAGVNAATVPATRFVTFAEQGEGQFGTGVAYANPSDTAAVITFTARDALGETLASVVRTLSPNGHDGQNMVHLFDLPSFTGSLEITSTEPIVSLSLNFEADPVFSSLPPGEVDAAAQ